MRSMATYRVISPKGDVVATKEIESAEGIGQWSWRHRGAE
jgi:hypothetical protein